MTQALNAIDGLLVQLDEQANPFMKHVDVGLGDAFTIRGAVIKPGQIAQMRASLKQRYANDPAKAALELGPLIQTVIDGAKKFIP